MRLRLGTSKRGDISRDGWEGDWWSVIPTVTVAGVRRPWKGLEGMFCQKGVFYDEHRGGGPQYMDLIQRRQTSIHLTSNPSYHTQHVWSAYSQREWILACITGSQAEDRQLPVHPKAWSGGSLGGCCCQKREEAAPAVAAPCPTHFPVFPWPPGTANNLSMAERPPTPAPALNRKAIST